MSGSVMPWGREIEYTTPTGIKTTLYNIGTLAEALGRTSQTIRKWEISGVIPPTPFKQDGKRLYSKEHLDALVECAEKSKIKQGLKLGDTSFTKRAYERFEEINDQFFNTKKYGSGGKK